MDINVINKIEKQLNQYRLSTQLRFQAETKSIFKKFPLLAELEKEKRLIISDFKISKEEKNNKLEKIKKEIEFFIKENNVKLPTEAYHCNICKDRGYVESDGVQKRCQCFEKMIMEESLKDDCIGSSKNFDDFNENIFTSDIKNDVLKIKKFLEDYSKAFPCVKKPNIFLTGNTGTGKTFLMSCVYYELKKRGISASFITAGKLFDILRKYAFNQIDDIDALLNVDILLIDDLGTEPMFNNITIEYLFLLINERARYEKPFFISTNLSPLEIKNHYNERISSRLLDKTITNIIFLPGNDLRLR